MDSKKEIIKKIVMSRRLLATSKLMKEANFCVENFLNLQEKYLQLLEELSRFQTIKITLTSERLNWKKEQALSFWEIECQKADDSFFKNNFRMNRATFYKLCELLDGLPKSHTNLSEEISLEKRVAIGLYSLGSTAEYQTIANMFGVQESRVCDIILSFCDEAWRALAPIYLKNFPLTKKTLETLTKEFEALGFPQCIGVLDGCHIEIHPSQADATDYFNYKGWYSIVLLALVDAKCRFIYVSCGSPGRCKDSQIFEESSLKKELDQCVLLNKLKKNISGVDVPLFVIGDSAYKLSDKIMKPYPFHASLSHQQKCFNNALSESHRVLENAFRHLKARFSRIGKGIDIAVKNANVITLSCCALHNFLIDTNDTINDRWLQALEVIEVNRFYPDQIMSLTDQSNGQNPERIREAISIYLSANDDGISEAIEGDSDDEGIGGDDGGELLLSEHCCVLIDEFMS